VDAVVGTDRNYGTLGKRHKTVDITEHLHVRSR
jgi:hypothetical protein